MTIFLAILGSSPATKKPEGRDFPAFSGADAKMGFHITKKHRKAVNFL